jgi:hypothetical protein
VTPRNQILCTPRTHVSPRGTNVATPAATVATAATANAGHPTQLTLPPLLLLLVPYGCCCRHSCCRRRCVSMGADSGGHRRPVLPVSAAAMRLAHVCMAVQLYEDLNPSAWLLTAGCDRSESAGEFWIGGPG